MLKVTATNAKNDTIQLTQSATYQLVSISGINPPTANIATVALATGDGSSFNYAKLPQRNIVLTIQPLGDIETLRTALYPYFTPKAKIRLDFFTKTRSVYIDGYVESCEIDYNANPQLMQVSVICPQPYFKDQVLTSIDLDMSNANTINNTCDVPLGVEFEITATSAISQLRINNALTIAEPDQLFVLTDLPVISGDKIMIDTVVGQKSVKRSSGGTITSLLKYLVVSSDWITLAVGNNSITVNLNGGSATGKIKFRKLYAGL